MDWDDTGNEVHREHTPFFDFTAHYAQPEFTTSGTVRRLAFRTALVTGSRLHTLHVLTRQVKIKGIRAERQRVRPVRRAQWGIKLCAQRQQSRMTVQTSAYQFLMDSWRVQGVLHRILRHLRSREVFSDDLLEGWQETWHIPKTLRISEHLKQHPYVFVQAEPGVWRLTPWVRLNVPFDIPHVHTDHGFYEREALRFWAEYQHVPTETEEWHSGVREQARRFMALTAVPAYFIETPRGVFVQTTPFGHRTFRLNVDALPEGAYFTLPSPHGDLTFSIEGRAFIQDGPAGPVIMTPFTTRRVREALTLDENAQGIRWHPVGLSVRRACEEAQITTTPP